MKDLKPLRIDHHFWRGKVSVFWDHQFDAKHFIYIGNVAPIYSQNEIETGSIHDQLQPMLQYLWQELPSLLTEAFKKGAKEPHKTTKIYIDEYKGSDFWENLKSYPCLYEINCTLWHDELNDILQTNPLITELTLKTTNQKVIDLSQSNIQKLSLDVTGVERLILNKDIYLLHLSGDFSSLQAIEDPFNGRYLLLSLVSFSNFPISSLGIKYLKTLHVMSKSIDISDIVASFGHLESLKLWGKNGELSHILKLKELKGLTTLWLMDTFGFDDFPKQSDLPYLSTLWLVNIPKSAGTKAKKEFKSIQPRIAKLRDEEWLKQNIKNPLGSWDGREGTPTSIAKKAMNLYSDTYKKLKQKSLSHDQMTLILKEFILSFNQIDKKYSIDTLEREEISEAFHLLGSLTSLSPKNLEALFDELRDF